MSKFELLLSFFPDELPFLLTLIALIWRAGVSNWVNSGTDFEMRIIV